MNGDLRKIPFMADPEELFAALELQASLVLSKPWSAEPLVAARPLLSLSTEPAFGAYRSWTVFDGPAGTLLVREIAWDRVSDLATFAEQFPGRERPRATKPSLAVRDASAPRASLEDLLDAAERFPLPGPAGFSPATGQIDAVRFDARPGAPEFRWGHELPAGWERIAEWAAEARGLLEEALRDSPR